MSQASAEERLLEREAQYRRIFEATSDGLVVNDLETGLVVEANPAFCRMHGYSYDELIGMHPTRFIHPDDHYLFDEYVTAISEGRDFLCRARQVRKDGTLLDVEVHGTSFLFRGRPHVLGVLRDVSIEAEATRLLEQRVAERTRELSSLLALANQAATTLELERLIQVVLPEVERVTGSAWVGIYLVEGESLLPTGEASAAQPAEPVQLPERRDALAAGEPITGDAALATGLFPGDAANADAVVLPLVASSELTGLLCLAHAGNGGWGEEQLALAHGVADQVAVAISNARRYQVSQQSAALEERHRIARDLHDSVSQSLFSLTLHARTAELALEQAGLDPGSVLGRALREVAELTRGALAEMRALIFELRPGALAEEGLGAALTKHAAAISAREGLLIEVQAPAERLPLSVAQEEQLYRLAQEALHNVVKHAHAGRARVELTPQAGSVQLLLRDDGRGFDSTQPVPGHLGLETMRERATRSGGQLTIESEPGAGTTVRVHIPITMEEHG